MDRYTLLHRLHWAIATAAFLAASCCTVLGLAWAVTHGDAGESEAFSVKPVLPDGSVGDELLPAPAPSPADLCFRYAARLNELEIAPNGDDFNAILALLAGGAYTEPHVTGR